MFIDSWVLGVLNQRIFSFFNLFRESCLSSGELFVDEEFPPDPDSIFFSKVSFFFSKDEDPDPLIF